MEIKGVVHCFFEQSGTFKNEFKKLGINAMDYDIQNNFGETDFVMDLFSEIDKAYDNLTRQDKTRQDKTVFDSIDPCQDLIVAFFPCIYFTGSVNPCYYRLDNRNYKNLTTEEKFNKILERETNRDRFYKILYKFCGICIIKGFRMVFENPYSSQHFLYNNFLKAPDVVDMNRMERGDYFKKPTAYWFWNCEPTNGFSYQKDKEQKIINKLAPNGTPGICNEERSMISSDYARNWICDFVLGKQQDYFDSPLFN